MKSSVFGADWIVPVGTPPLREAAVVVEDARIAWLGPVQQIPSQWRSLPVQWSEGVMTPGLVNAHTHLQYSDFDSLGRGQYRDFEDWSDAFEVLYLAVNDSRSWSTAATKGVGLGLATGTTVFSDVVTDTSARGAIGAANATGIEFLEVIAETNRSWREGGRDALLARLEQIGTTPAGLSPHAPYSVDPQVVADLVKIAGSRGLRLHSHLAESSVEEALYLSGDPRVLAIYGDLRDEYQLIRQGGAGMKSATFANSLGLLSPCTHIAHGVYVDRHQRDLLRDSGTRVALCPRSNATIGLEKAPVAAYLREGHDLAVGTDSLASSPSLDLMADVRMLAEIARDQGYDDGDLMSRLFEAATVGGARALGMADAGYGTLRAGGPADFALFAVEVKGDRVEQALVEQGEGCCVLTVAGGCIAHDRRCNYVLGGVDVGT
ncbi:UNVERIFIED_ORG: amidohydrolase family protein (plasmid) [Roseateles sp. XES5]|nr:amidohydrolase family protein [Roseateles sp. XES5]